MQKKKLEKVSLHFLQSATFNLETISTFLGNYKMSSKTNSFYTIQNMAGIYSNPEVVHILSKLSQA